MTSPAGAASGAQGDGGGEAEAQQGPDVGALSEQLQQMSGGMEEMRTFLMSQPWAQQEQGDEGAGAEPETAPLDLSFLDEQGYDDGAAKELASVIERQWQQREEALRNDFSKQLGSVTERVSERERMEQMRDLVEEFPDMANPEVAQQVVGQAHELVQANGWPEQMSADPRFWRLAYAAQQAFAAAQEEGRDGPQAAHLEGGGGAASAQRDPGDDFRQMLDDQAATGRRAALPFP